MSASRTQHARLEEPVLSPCGFANVRRLGKFSLVGANPIRMKETANARVGAKRLPIWQTRFWSTPVCRRCTRIGQSVQHRGWPAAGRFTVRIVVSGNPLQIADRDSRHLLRITPMHGISLRLKLTERTGPRQAHDEVDIFKR